MISDPSFYLVAIPAVILFGLSKSGLGAALSIPSVPLIALYVSPLEAVAIMLPLMLVMDVVAVTAYRRDFDVRTLKIIVPGGIAGVIIGWLTASIVTDAHVRLMIGVIAVWFALAYWFGGGQQAEPKPHNPLKGRVWSTVSGFTSFVAHAGGVPLQMYTLPLKFDPRLLVGTSAMFLATVNVAKLPAYTALGGYTREVLLTALVLAPIAPIAILAGVWLVKRIPKGPFYQITYAGVLLIGLKMLWDGATGLMG
ncbi:MAG: sulfite exporter TauE/SafE family protein [Pseudomonadota bacterium]